jgi:hypothetical protein
MLTEVVFNYTILCQGNWSRRVVKLRSYRVQARAAQVGREVSVDKLRAVAMAMAMAMAS